ncbi:MAG: 2-hydroxyacyl-CoA dehydratase family protein [Candidatus Zixiibacteriota bacterium]
MKIGITTTIPVEIIYAAGHVPIDLNNSLVSSQIRDKLISSAEYSGYPRNICGWIKGIYGSVIRMLEKENLSTIIAVTQGDCSNTHALMETLELAGVRTIPFAFPYDRSRRILKEQIDELADKLGADWPKIRKWKKRLDDIRHLAHQIDFMTYDSLRFTGQENSLALINCSDFKSSPDIFEKELKEMLEKRKTQKRDDSLPRIGMIGVPPIMLDFHDTIENYGSHIVFNEVQRQFAMPFDTDDILEQYLKYTYPYSVFQRLDDIDEQIKNRRIDGLVHYVQSFCFRQIEDMIFRKKLDIPILTIEGGDNFETDERQKMRIQAFVEMLARK